MRKTPVSAHHRWVAVALVFSIVEVESPGLDKNCSPAELGGSSQDLYSKWLGSPPFFLAINFGHLKKGSHNLILRGRTRSPWLLTTEPNWDDPTRREAQRADESLQYVCHTVFLVSWVFYHVLSIMGLSALFP